MSNIGERIAELRKMQGLTKVECSKRLGIAASTLSQYELGKRKINIEWLAKIAGFFGVSTEYLLGRTEYEKIYPAHSFDEIFLNCESKTISNGEFYIKLSKLTPQHRTLLNAFVDEMIAK